MVELKTDAVAVAQLVVTETKAQAKAARRALADLLEARKPLAVQASGDGEISAALKANRDSIVDAELAVSDAQTRLDDAEQKLADAERKQADDEAEKRLAEARQLADALIEQSARFDKAMADGVAALVKRDRLAIKIRATGCLRAGAAEGLASRSRIRSAFGTAGLHHFLDEFIARRHCQKLAVSDGSLPLQKPTRKSEAERSKPPTKRSHKWKQSINLTPSWTQSSSASPSSTQV